MRIGDGTEDRDGSQRSRTHRVHLPERRQGLQLQGGAESLFWTPADLVERGTEMNLSPVDGFVLGVLATGFAGLAVWGIFLVARKT